MYMYLLCVWLEEQPKVFDSQRKVPVSQDSGFLAGGKLWQSLNEFVMKYVGTGSHYSYNHLRKVSGKA